MSIKYPPSPHRFFGVAQVETHLRKLGDSKTTIAEIKKICVGQTQVIDKYTITRISSRNYTII